MLRYIGRDVKRRREELMLAQKVRAETCIWETAFGDASIADVESDSHHLYAHC